MYCFCLAELLVHFEYKVVVHVQVVLCYVFVLTWCMYYHLNLCETFFILLCSCFLPVGTTGSTAVCISPLTAIIVEQNAKFKNLGIVAEFVEAAQTNPDAQRCELQGEVQIILVSPKM